jgi:hypothetical protein
LLCLRPIGSFALRFHAKAGHKVQHLMKIWAPGSSLLWPDRRFAYFDVQMTWLSGAKAFICASWALRTHEKCREFSTGIIRGLVVYCCWRPFGACHD